MCNAGKMMKFKRIHIWENDMKASNAACTEAMKPIVNSLQPITLLSLSRHNLRHA